MSIVIHRVGELIIFQFTHYLDNGVQEPVCCVCDATATFSKGNYPHTCTHNHVIASRYFMRACRIKKLSPTGTAFNRRSFTCVIVLVVSYNKIEATHVFNQCVF